MIVRHDHVNLGLAVDVAKSDGSRTLLVPNVKQADDLDFAGFFAAYEEMIRKVRTGKITPDDFAGTTATITNPGMIGTVHSVPRLMPGQGFILGVGAIGYPAQYEGADPHTIARLGVSKVITLTSTYDHRVIQGAESGEFLRAVHDLLLGEHDFYDAIFQSFAVPYEPARWSTDISPLDDEAALNEKVVHVHQLINMYRVRGHLLANLDPLGSPRARHPHRARRQPLRAEHLGPRPRVPGRLARRGTRRPALDATARHPRGAARRLRPNRRRRVHAHAGSRAQGMDPDPGRGIRARARPRSPAAHPRSPQRGRSVRELLAEEVPRPEALQPRGRGVADPDARRAPLLRGRRRTDRRRAGDRAPRPSQRARQHRGQELQPDLPRVRGRARPLLRAGFRRREVPRRCHGDPRRAVGRDRRRDARVEPESPRSRRPGRGRHGTRRG